MTASEWNEKHPVGTRVLIFHQISLSIQRGFIAETPVLAVNDGYVWVCRCGMNEENHPSGWYPDNLEPISAYPGDIYTGKPLKKVRHDED